MKLTQERLKELLDYCPDTGLFYWRVGRGRVKKGDQTGVCNSHGYRVIRVEGRNYGAHRLAWLWMTGGWPECEIDHRNLDHADNRWINLRPADGSQNKANRKGRGKYPKGVCFHVASGLFSARVHKNGRQISLGYHKTVEAAHAAYCVAAQKVHGEFARTN